MFLLFILPLTCYSQEIFHAEYSTRYSSSENYNDLQSYKNFIQLIIYDNNTYTLESEVFVITRKKEKKSIRCSKRNGTWTKDKNILTLTAKNRITEYRISSNKKKLFDVEAEVNSIIARKTRFKKTNLITVMNCKEDTIYDQSDIYHRDLNE